MTNPVQVELVSKGYGDSAYAPSGQTVPAGGTTGQVVTRQSDGTAGWSNPAATAGVNTVDGINGNVNLAGHYLPQQSFTDEQSAYAWVLTDAVGRIAMWLDNSGLPGFPGGVTIGDRATSKVANDQFVVALVDSTGRVAENAIGLDGRIPQFVLDAIASRINPALWPFTRQVPVTTKNVKQDGTGDYTTIGAAITAANTAVFYNPYTIQRIYVHPGTYAETNLNPTSDGAQTLLPGPGMVQVIGTNRDKCIVTAYLPANSTDPTITATAAFNLFNNATVSSLTVTAQNMRYPIHHEGAGTNPNAQVVIENCHLEHLGNQEVIDYRNANPGQPAAGQTAATVWSSWIAFGYGGASGQYTLLRRCTLKGRSTFYVHNDQNFADPMKVVLEKCRLVGLDNVPDTSRKSVVTIGSTGSGTDDEMTFDGCEFDVTSLSDSDSPWISTTARRQVADHREFRITMQNCSPIGYVNAHRSTALRITSASTGATSTVRVSGTAADAAFGVAGLPVYRDGGGGMQGYAYGYWDVSGILVGINSDQTVGNTIGKRLGDCSTTSKTLTVTVDGGTPINVVFATDQTALSNASIIASINTALGSAATASEYLVGPGEAYPQIPDKTVEQVNSGTAAIPRWAAVKYGTSRRQVALMQPGDAASLFVGVALAATPPGKTCRVLTQGVMRYDQLYGFTGGAGAIVSGTAIGLSATTAGAFTASATNQVMSGQDTDWAYFKGNR